MKVKYWARKVGNVNQYEQNHRYKLGEPGLTRIKHAIYSALPRQPMRWTWSPVALQNHKHCSKYVYFIQNACMSLKLYCPFSYNFEIPLQKCRANYLLVMKIVKIYFLYML